MTSFSFDIVGFDLDGTLVDSSVDLAAAVNHALASQALPSITVAQARAMIGGGAGQLLRAALATAGAQDADFDALHRHMLDHYAAHLAVHTHPFPGALAALDELHRRGVRLAIVTNKIERFTLRLLDELGLTDRFAVILGGDSLPPAERKPSPGAMRRMMADCGGGRAAFVGDSTFDVRSAKGAGLPVVAVSFGFSDVPVETMGADAVIDHFDALVPALERL